MTTYDTIYIFAINNKNYIFSYHMISILFHKWHKSNLRQQICEMMFYLNQIYLQYMYEKI